MRGTSSRLATGFARGASGLVVLAIVLLVVLGWWGDFRDATRGDADEGSQESAVSAEPTVTPEGGEEQPSPGTPKTDGTEKKVVVLVEGLNFRAGPSRGSALIRGLAEGAELVHLGTEGGWHHVRDADGTVGYVSASEQYSKVR